MLSLLYSTQINMLFVLEVSLPYYACLSKQPLNPLMVTYCLFLLYSYNCLFVLGGRVSVVWEICNMLLRRVPEGADEEMQHYL